MRVIADRYELETRLGSGGMGTVWRATDRMLERTVAVKLLHEGLASDTAFAERFRREARSAARLGHPNIVAVYDTGETEGVPYIVMEYVAGDTLHQVLTRDGPLPVEDTARIARSVLGALAHAHDRGLVHRDMKPANVLFDTATGEAKVADFGIAKGLEDTGGLTRTSGLIGTAAYLSPEQVSGHDATPASDLYAVGCMLYACLAGEPPFAGGTPVAIAMKHVQTPVPPLRARRPDVPPAFDAVVGRALSKDPSRRFGSAAEMSSAVAATGLDRRPSSQPTVVTAAPTAAAARPGTEVLPRGTGGRGGPGDRGLAALAAFLVVAAIAAIVVLYLQNRESGVLEAPIPTTTPAQTEQAVTSTPSPTVQPTPADNPEATPQGPLLDLPGIIANDPGDDEPTPEPTPSPTPSPVGDTDDD